LSPVPSSPRSHKAPPEDRIYTVATDRTIKSVMKEFRKRKQAQMLPKPVTSSRAAKSTVTGSGQANRTNSASKSSKDHVDQQIEEQQRSSIMKVNSDS
jgi:brefeldin A-inhibited guanine nucleotide-exchange protein 3